MVLAIATVFICCYCWVDGICGSGQSGTVKNRGVENAGVDNSAPLWQGWTMQEWSEVTKAAYKITIASQMIHYT